MVIPAFTTAAATAGQLESEVHVWLARPDDAADLPRLAERIAILSADECERYHRLRFSRDRHLFLVAHALVRRVLSRYVPVEPSAWQFTRNEYGRPEITGSALPVKLRFNLSHTDGLAACVVTLENDCGIDVETRAARRRMQGIAEKVLAEPEQRDLREREGTAGYPERFLGYWTLREAWCKALGTGLAHMDRSVWFDLDTEGCCSIHGADAPGAGHWHAELLSPTAEHVLAVAVHSDDGVKRPVVCRFVES
jgi:4'-phosphopantetheinyl transferase